MHQFQVRSSEHTQFINIDNQVQEIVDSTGVAEGVVIMFVPHTTAGLTINENADRDVQRDMIEALERAVPWKTDFYRHGEGNSAAHVKSSMFGCSSQILVSNGRLQFGTWQSLYFCEFDGPRTRSVWVQVLSTE